MDKSITALREEMLDIIVALATDIEENYIDAEFFRNFMVQNEHILNKIDYKKIGDGCLDDFQKHQNLPVHQYHQIKDYINHLYITRKNNNI